MLSSNGSGVEADLPCLQLPQLCGPNPARVHQRGVPETSLYNLGYWFDVTVHQAAELPVEHWVAGPQ